MPHLLLRRAAPALLIATLAPAATAQATVVERVDTADGPVIAFQAGPGVADVVDVYHQNGQIAFSAIAGNSPYQSTTCSVPPSRPWEIACDANGVAAIQLETGDGNDTVNASTGSPAQVPVIVDGGPGDDQLTGGAGPVDLLGGGDGNDTLNDSAGADLLDGGAGNDRFWSGLASEGDQLSGGDGTDTAVFARDTAFTVTLDAQANDGAPGEGDDVRVENLLVNGGGATFVGDDGPNTLGTEIGSGSNRFEGRGGNDVLSGGQGSDELFGGDGDDKLTGEDGDDLLDGGAGRDTFIGDRQNFAHLEGVGNDTIRARDGVADSINCGPGGDVAEVDQLDVLPTDAFSACESVDRGVVGGPAPGPGPSPGAGSGGGGGVVGTPAGKPAPRSLGLTVRRSGAAKVVARGKLALPAGVARSACRGAKVTLRVLRGTRVVGRATATVSRTCTYRATVKLRRGGGGKLSVVASYGGSAKLGSKRQTVSLR